MDLPKSVLSFCRLEVGGWNPYGWCGELDVRLQDDLLSRDDLLKRTQIRVSWCNGTNRQVMS